MSQNGNPLIGTTNGDTIAETRAYVRWLLQVMDSDGQTERGVLCSLRLVLGAVESLGESTGPEKPNTKSVEKRRRVVYSWPLGDKPKMSR